MDASLRKSIVVAVSLVAVQSAAVAVPPPLIPRRVLFGNPDRISPQVSPDGKRLAYIAPDDDVLNLWLRTIGEEDDRPVTHDRNRGIRSYFWATNAAQLLYLQDTAGDGNAHLFVVNPDRNEVRNLTPFPGAQARVIAADEFPDAVLVSINDRDEHFHDVYRINVRSGARTLQIRNTLGFVGYVADREMEVRAGVTVRRDGGITLHVRDDWASPWRELKSWGPRDALNSGPVAFSHDGRSLLIIDSEGANTGELHTVRLRDGLEAVVAKDPVADVADLFIHPKTHEVQAVGFLRERLHWKVLDPTIRPCFKAMASVRRGEFGVINRDRNDDLWVVYYNSDDGPLYYYLFDRAVRKAVPLFPDRTALQGHKLAQMEPITLEARDGLTLHGYLTTPTGVPARHLPTVLLVHGGPWSRDRWGYNDEVQWLANRGYAVLQVNFRGSAGYGKAFLNAGNREWGGKMQTDLVDAIKWAVDQGIADPDRLAVFGSSYGGYAALTALTDTPEMFQCAVDVSGPTSLITFMKTIPPYWKAVEPILWDRVGHPEKDVDFLQSRSPFTKIDRIVRPLLIAQGANDKRVVVDECRKMVQKLRDAGRDVEYLEFADERHGLTRPENRMHFYARAEAFLAKHLGGRHEPDTSADGRSADPK